MQLIFNEIEKPAPPRAALAGKFSATAPKPAKMLALLAMHGALAWHAPHGKRVAPCTPLRKRSPVIDCMASKDSDGRSNCKKRRKKQNENVPGEAADAASGRVTSDSLMLSLIHI